MDFVERGMEEKQEGKEGKETDASSNTIHLSSVFDIFPALGNPLGLSAFERFLTQSNEDTEAEDAICELKRRPAALALPRQNEAKTRQPRGSPCLSTNIPCRKGAFPRNTNKYLIAPPASTHPAEWFNNTC